MSVLIGTNTAEAHPVIASRMKRAQKLFGQKIHVFDIRNTKWRCDCSMIKNGNS